MSKKISKAKRIAAAKKAAATRKRNTSNKKSKKHAKKAARTRVKTGGHTKKTQELKDEVFSHYSRGKPKCACCRENTSLDFLCMDHIAGRKNHKGEVDKRRGMSLYSYLKTHGYPSGYQVLCWNCNSTKFVYTICPHKRKKS